jgi:hypothetical protein
MKAKRATLFGFLGAVSILICGCGHRYQAVAGTDGRVYRLDQQTGEFISMNTVLPTPITNATANATTNMPAELPGRFQLIPAVVRGVFTGESIGPDVHTAFKIDTQTGRTWMFYRGTTGADEWDELTNRDINAR